MFRAKFSVATNSSGFKKRDQQMVSDLECNDEKRSCVLFVIVLLEGGVGKVALFFLLSFVNSSWIEKGFMVSHTLKTSKVGNQPFGKEKNLPNLQFFGVPCQFWIRNMLGHCLSRPLNTIAGRQKKNKKTRCFLIFSSSNDQFFCSRQRMAVLAV